MRENDIITGLDIGTTKVCAVIGQVRESSIEIIGVGSSPSYGLRKGVVVNIDSTVDSITKAVEEAELMAGVEVNSVYAGIAGGHIKGMNSRGVIAVSSKDREIRQADVNRAIDAAKAVSIPMDREVIHVFPQEYIVDDQDGIKDPIGMSGVRLEVEIHIVTGAVTSAQNIVKSVNRAGFAVNDIVLQPYSAALAVLTPEEKELGVVLSDMGGGTTDIIMFVNGSVRYTGVLAIGGNHITNDIAVGLRTPAISAEAIKKKYGCADSSLINPEDMIEVPSVGGRAPRKISKKVLSEIIQPRYTEIMTLVQRELRMTGFEDLIAAGMVITGGGSLIEGSAEITEKIVGLPVRMGYPGSVRGLVDVINSPIYATGVGLVLFGMKYGDHSSVYREQGDSLFKNISRRMGDWFREFF